MQVTVTAGDTLEFSATFAGYPATDGWTLQYRLTARAAGGDVIEFTATADGESYAVSVAPTVTADWTAGEYGYVAWVEKSGARTVVDSGQCTILPDPINVEPGTDTRSQAERAVADLKAAYATFVATQGKVAEYEIAGRRMKFASAADIAQRLSFWNGELSSEQAKKAVAAGFYDPRRIYLRVGRA